MRTYIGIWTSGQKEMSLKDIFIKTSGGPFDKGTRTIFCNSGRMYYEEYFCEIIVNLHQ